MVLDSIHNTMRIQAPADRVTTRREPVRSLAAFETTNRPDGRTPARTASEWRERAREKPVDGDAARSRGVDY